MSDKISVKDAQAEINGLLVAEICRDFGINFLGVYPEHILARGVGPEQAFIGLAIKRGHLALPAVQPDAAAIREAALVTALDAAFPIVRKAYVAAKMDAVNASPSDPTALRREAWIRECDAALELVVSALALIDNTGKEVMPPVPVTNTPNEPDIGPGDQAVAGAAPRTDAELLSMQNRADWTEDFAHENGNYMCLCATCGKRFCGHKRRVTCRVCAQPEPVSGADPVTVQDALVDRLARSICLSAHGDLNPCPVSDEMMPRQWMILRDRYHSMAHAALRAIPAKPEPVAGAAPVTVQEAARVLKENVHSPQYQDAIQAAMLHGLSPHKAHAIIGGFLHALAQKGGASGDTLHLHCATEGCGRRVSTRFDGRDYCEPCGRKVAGGTALDCECGMGFGPCMDPECKAPILVQKGGA
jgi:hypothetical protein